MVTYADKLPEAVAVKLDEPRSQLLWERRPTTRSLLDHAYVILKHIARYGKSTPFLTRIIPRR